MYEYYVINDFPPMEVLGWNIEEVYSIDVAVLPAGDLEGTLRFLSLE
jgi:hypothetical protein